MKPPSILPPILRPIALACAALGLSQGPTARIYADSDVRITFDGAVAHMEAYIAASATNPQLLYAGGELLVSGAPAGSLGTHLWVSRDGGARWTSSTVPNGTEGGWDNAFVGGAGDTAYFFSHQHLRGYTLYHTYDGGKAWFPAAVDGLLDRPHAAIDLNSAKYRGRVYLAAEGRNGVVVVSSSDGGKTFTAPVTACAQRANMSAATSGSPAVLSDGTLVVVCWLYPSYPERTTWTDAEMQVVVSRDGGATFDAPRALGIAHRLAPEAAFAERGKGHVLTSGNFMLGPSFAAAPKGAAHENRLYAAWQDITTSSNARILMSWSDDQGATWSVPAAVARSTGMQGMPMLAVNRDGVVGVAWLDSRHAPDARGYDAYFTASVDGGLTFLPATRLSASTSRPIRGANATPMIGGGAVANGEQTFRMVSPYNTRATGGDYATMTSDAEGRFHPLWVDGRDDAWQLYTSTVRVTSAIPRANVCFSDPSRLQAALGEARWNAAESTVDVPVRLINESNDTVTRSVSVIVRPAGPSWSARVKASGWVPLVYDPQRRAYSDSAKLTFDASSNMPLFPHATTRPVVVRLKVAAPERMEFTVKTRVIGCSTTGSD